MCLEEKNSTDLLICLYAKNKSLNVFGKSACLLSLNLQNLWLLLMLEDKQIKQAEWVTSVC